MCIAFLKEFGTIVELLKGYRGESGLDTRQREMRMAQFLKRQALGESVTRVTVQVSLATSAQIP